MVTAMMLPSVLRTVVLRDKGVARFLAGYVVAWTGFGAVALAGDATVHRLAESWRWLAERPFVVSATVLVAAGLYQVSPSKRRCLDAVQRAGSGIRYTASCLGCCGSLMLTMFAVGMERLAWMTALTVVMVAERTAANGHRIASAAGALLIGMGLLAAASSATLM
jgi:predicted metal-binding membrane protein